MATLLTPETGTFRRRVDRLGSVTYNEKCWTCALWSALLALRTDLRCRERKRESPETPELQKLPARGLAVGKWNYAIRENGVPRNGGRDINGDSWLLIASHRH